MRTIMTFSLVGLIILAAVHMRAQRELQATVLAREHQELDCLRNGNLAALQNVVEVASDRER